MLTKAYMAIKQVEETLEGALGDIAGSVEEIKQRLDGLNAEFFTEIFSGVVQGLKDELAEAKDQVKKVIDEGISEIRRDISGIGKPSKLEENHEENKWKPD